MTLFVHGFSLRSTPTEASPSGPGPFEATRPVNGFSLRSEPREGLFSAPGEATAWLGCVAALGFLLGCTEVDCEPFPVPGEMTVERARSLRPEVEQGVAISTSRFLGTCPEDEDIDRCEAPSCGTVRRSVEAWLVPIEGPSLPVEDACSTGWSVSTLAGSALETGWTSDRGEAVWAAPVGLYVLGFAEEGARCARCGAVGTADQGCRLEVRNRTVTVRNLVY